MVNKPELVGEWVAKELGLARVTDYGPAKLRASGDAVISEFSGTQLGAFTDEAWAKMQHALAMLDPTPADLFPEATKTKDPKDRA